MIVGGVVVGSGKGLKFNLPKTKDIKIIEIKRKYVIVEWFIEGEKQITKHNKEYLLELLEVDKIQVNNKYTVDRMKFINTMA